MDFKFLQIDQFAPPILDKIRSFTVPYDYLTVRLPCRTVTVPYGMGHAGYKTRPQKILFQPKITTYFINLGFEFQKINFTKYYVTKLLRNYVAQKHFLIKTRH